MSLECFHCAFRCYSRDVFTLHMAENHLFTVWYQCHNCAEKFTAKDDVVRHIVQVHNSRGASKEIETTTKDDSGHQLRIKSEMGNFKDFDAPAPQGVQVITIMDSEDEEAPNPGASQSVAKKVTRRKYKTTKEKRGVFSSGKIACRFCYKFYTKLALKLHIRERHTHSHVRFRCGICPRIYKRKSILKDHMSKAHPDVEMSKADLNERIVVATQTKVAPPSLINDET